jgi:DNA-binding transcriptional LysR family regulator
MLGSMELRHLRYFVTVAEEQNVTRAAARLGVSQPPLSRQIRDLEIELGVALLDRAANSVKLTDAGAMFLGEARDVLQRADEAVEAVRTLSTKAPRSLRLGYAPSLTVEILPAALREFERRSPGTKVSLHDLSTEEMLSGLRDSSIQAALMIRTLDTCKNDLRFIELKRYSVCVAIPSSHPMAKGRNPSLKYVFGERLIAYTQADYPEYWHWLAGLAPTTFHVSEEHDSSTSLIAAVEAGRGIAVVPESFACFAGARVLVRPIAGALPPFIVGVATAANVPGTVDTFVSAVRSVVAPSTSPSLRAKAPPVPRGA